MCILIYGPGLCDSVVTMVIPECIMKNDIGDGRTTSSLKAYGGGGGELGA